MLFHLGKFGQQGPVFAGKQWGKTAPIQNMTQTYATNKVVTINNTNKVAIFLIIQVKKD
jgi:hypothetical protein